jgi:hypothetical protein
MSHEAILFVSLQGALALLVGLGLTWTKEIRKDVWQMREDIATALRETNALGVRATAIEQNAEHVETITNSRLERVSGRVSDLSISVERMDATIAVCPNCPQPKRARSGEWVQP